MSSHKSSYEPEDRALKTKRAEITAAVRTTASSPDITRDIEEFSLAEFNLSAVLLKGSRAMRREAAEIRARSIEARPKR
jgi:hypothetical protein